mgnify:CR=1 FL=1
MKKYIVVTGGAGFVGSNLIQYLLLEKKYKIISLDDYSSGSKKNHIKNTNVIYIKGNTIDMNRKLKRFKNKIKVVFHFGEFARIHQSFIDTKKCFSSNISGTSNVFHFCLENKIKVIYSATSASLGNKGNDQSLSPYAFTKSKNLQLLNHLNKWFGLSYESLYFYNVYGPRHIRTGPMATVIGIFEKLYEEKKPLTVVLPGTQSRKFTHVNDTIKGCLYAWKKNKNRHYTLSNTRSYTIFQVAKFFTNNLRTLPPKLGEREKSSIVKKIGKLKIYSLKCKINLKSYIEDFKKKCENK